MQLSIPKAESDRPHSIYTVVVQYVDDQGELKLPVAGPPGTPAVIVALHAPVGQKVVTWTAQRFGAPPDLPDYAPRDANERLARREIVPAKPVLDTSLNGFIFAVNGVYVYHLLKPIDPKDGLRVPGGPYSNTDATSWVVRHPLNFKRIF